jgi:hypothetical protein
MLSRDVDIAATDFWNEGTMELVNFSPIKGRADLGGIVYSMDIVRGLTFVDAAKEYAKVYGRRCPQKQRRLDRQHGTHRRGRTNGIPAGGSEAVGAYVDRTTLATSSVTIRFLFPQMRQRSASPG